MRYLAPAVLALMLCAACGKDAATTNNTTPGTGTNDTTGVADANIADAATFDVTVSHGQGDAAALALLTAGACSLSVGDPAANDLGALAGGRTLVPLPLGGSTRQIIGSQCSESHVTKEASCLTQLSPVDISAATSGVLAEITCTAGAAEGVRSFSYFSTNSRNAESQTLLPATRITSQAALGQLAKLAGVADGPALVAEGALLVWLSSGQADAPQSGLSLQVSAAGARTIYPTVDFSGPTSTGKTDGDGLVLVLPPAGGSLTVADVGLGANGTLPATAVVARPGLLFQQVATP